MCQWHSRTPDRNKPYLWELPTPVWHVAFPLVHSPCHAQLGLDRIGSEEGLGPHHVFILAPAFPHPHYSVLPCLPFIRSLLGGPLPLYLIIPQFPAPPVPSHTTSPPYLFFPSQDPFIPMCIPYLFFLGMLNPNILCMTFLSLHGMCILCMCNTTGCLPRPPTTMCPHYSLC